MEQVHSHLSSIMLVVYTRLSAMKPNGAVSAPPPTKVQKPTNKRSKPDDAQTRPAKRAKAHKSFEALEKMAEIVQAALDLNKKPRFNHSKAALSEEQLSKQITKDSFEQWDATVGQNIVNGLKLFMIGSGDDNRAYVQLPEALAEIESLRKSVEVHEAKELELQATVKSLEERVEELEKPAATAANLVGDL